MERKDKQQFTNCIGFINDKIRVLIAINEPTKANITSVGE